MAGFKEMLELMHTLHNQPSGEGLLEQYVPLVEFLGQSLGPNTEIVLHDLDIPDKSIVAIANGHISGRKLGGPVTDFALWFMRQGDAAAVPMLTGYRAINAEGKICRSSSYFLRDETGHMRGMLCINVDVSALVQIRDIANELIDKADDPAMDKSNAFGGYTPPEQVHAAAHPDIVGSRDASMASIAAIGAPSPHPEGVTQSARAAAASAPTADVSESLRDNVEQLMESMLDKALAGQGVPLKRMQRDERIEVVRVLEEDGFFLLKGGIAAAAKRLGVSEPTIYRYLVHVRG